MWAAARSYAHGRSWWRAYSSMLSITRWTSTRRTTTSASSPCEPKAVSETWIGRSLRRREDPPLLQGPGRYAGDNPPPGTVHIAVRRAGVPRAGGLAVDVSPALAMPGVIGAWSAGQIGLADDYMPNPTPRPQPVRRPVLARGEVRFEGDAVAVVAAETDYQAHDAVDAIEVELNAVADEAEALPSRTHSLGEAAPAVEHAPVQVRQRLRMGRICGAAVPPRAAFADWDDASQALVITAHLA